MRGWGLFWIIGTLVVASCLQENDGGGVGNLEPARWELRPEPTLILGGVGMGGPELFEGLVGAAWMSDGSIVVADVGADQIRRFAADGTHLETTGREGRGPGEFRNLWRLSIGPGDTIWGFNQNGRAIVGFHGGEYRRDLTIDRGTPLGWVDGAVVSAGIPRISRGPEPRTPGLHRDPWRILVHSADGNTVDTLARGLSEERFLTEDLVWGRPVIERDPFVALGSNFVIFGDGEWADLVILDLEGDTLGTIPVGHVEGPTLDRLAENRRAARVENAAAERKAQVRSVVNAMPTPETFTDMSGLIVDEEDFIWVQRVFMPADSVARWDVFDRDGGQVAWILVPVALTVREIASDAILATDRDDLEVPRVLVYELRR